MRRAARFLVAAALMLLCGGAATPEWLRFETYRFPGYVIIVEIAEGEEDSPRLVLAGHWNVRNGFSIYSRQWSPEGGLAKLRDATGEGLPPSTLGSDYLYAVGPIDPAKGPRLIIAFGRAFASDPGPMEVYRPGRRQALVLADIDAFLLEDVADLDHDGLPELIGHRSLSQSFDDCRYTYDPYTVLRQAGPDELFQPNDELSKAYTLGKGYPWAGPNAREDVAVNKCGAKPVLEAAPKV